MFSTKWIHEACNPRVVSVEQLCAVHSFKLCIRGAMESST
jgi:hypothetical protein